MWWIYRNKFNKAPFKSLYVDETFYLPNLFTLLLLKVCCRNLILLLRDKDWRIKGLQTHYRLTNSNDLEYSTYSTHPLLFLRFMQMVWNCGTGIIKSLSSEYLCVNRVSDNDPHLHQEAPPSLNWQARDQVPRTYSNSFQPSPKSKIGKDICHCH